MPNTPISNMKAADPGLAFNVNLDADELSSIALTDKIRIQVSVKVEDETAHKCNVVINEAENLSPEDPTLVIALPFRCANYDSSSKVAVTILIFKRQLTTRWKKVYTYKSDSLPTNKDKVLDVNLIARPS